MTFDRFGDPGTEGTLASDMERARGYKPITQEDLTKAYSQYGEVGAKFGLVKKTDSDTALYNKAKKFVLDWWKKEKTDAAKLDKPPTSGGGGSPVAGGGSTGTGRTGGSTTGRGSGGSSYVGGMPDTAMGLESGTYKPLPHILTQTEIAQQRLARERGMLKANQEDLVGSKAPVPLTPSQVSATLKKMGAPTTWNPPASARTSPEALQAWVTRAATNSQLVLAANKAPVYNDAYVTNVIRNLNMTQAISAKSVPPAYRTDPTKLKNYLLSVSAAQKLAAQKRQVSQQAANAARMTRRGVF